MEITSGPCAAAVKVWGQFDLHFRSHSRPTLPSQSGKLSPLQRRVHYDSKSHLGIVLRRTQTRVRMGYPGIQALS